MLRASWQLSACLAALLFAGAAVCAVTERQRLATLRAFCLQFGVVVAVFAVYQHSAHYAYTLTDGAQQRAAHLVDLEQRFHLPSELTLQQLVLPHPAVVQFENWYYAGVHLTSMTAFLVWVWWRHRAYYVFASVWVAVTTLACVTIQHLPTAPPRLMPGLGFVDTAAAYGQSMYGPHGFASADQLAAMPSVHVAWAAIIAAFAVGVSRSPWRWLLVGHFALTCFVVVSTANHWWLDGVVAVAVAAAALVVSWLVVLSPSRGRAAASPRTDALAPVATG